MQVARTFFFTTKREWSRKMKEILMAAELDAALLQAANLRALRQRHLSRQSRQLCHSRFRRRAAEAYFGKDVRDI